MYLANVYNIMIASPGDVSDERKIAREIILDWNNLHSRKRKIVLLPLLWEYNATPSMDDRAQGVVNKQVLKNADLLVGIFWTRIGTPTGKALSGSVEEIEEHIATGKPAMLYFSSKPAELEKVDRNQYDAVQKLREDYKNRGFTDAFDSVENFKEKFQRHLQMKLNEEDVFQGIADNHLDNEQESQLTPYQLSGEAKILLKEASKDEHGQIIMVSSIGGGFSIQTNGRVLNGEGGAREKARWSAALNELLRQELAIGIGWEGNMFELTKLGFQCADEIEE